MPEAHETTQKLTGLTDESFSAFGATVRRSTLTIARIGPIRRKFR